MGMSCALSMPLTCAYRGPTKQLTLNRVAQWDLHELRSKLLKGGYIGDYIIPPIGFIKGDTRSLDHSSHVPEEGLHAPRSSDGLTGPCGL